MSEEKHWPKLMNHSCNKKNYKVLFCRLTPELSRADRGSGEPVLRQLELISTKPRHGVGLNDLLGGKEAGEGETQAYLPKGRSPDA